MKLSPNFSLEELTHSDAAIRLGIDNTPNDVVIANLKWLCLIVLEPLRDLLKRPIHINSGYRCEALNKAIGGAKNSQHILGQAADKTVEGMTVEQVYQAIKNSNIQFDQCIQEFNAWTHTSWGVTPRHESLRATKINSQTIYTADKK